jgi:LPXTG-site transpeptidase (sortase) family protein
MLSRTYFTWGAGAVFAVVLGTFILTGGLSDQSFSAEPTAYASVQNQQTNPWLPGRLKIPKIGVDAAIESVGLTQGGAAGVPKNPGDVAWFNLSPRPGDEGNSIIDGHFGWKDGQPAVFDKLSNLRPGDAISVESAEGITTTFVVRELRTYGLRENVSEVFHSSDGKAHLNLITCEGVWDAVSKSYSKRLVVFADKDTPQL